MSFCLRAVRWASRRSCLQRFSSPKSNDYLSDSSWDCVLSGDVTATGAAILDADLVAVASRPLQLAPRAVRPAVGTAHRLQSGRRRRRGRLARREETELLAALLRQRLTLGRHHGRSLAHENGKLRFFTMMLDFLPNRITLPVFELPGNAQDKSRFRQRKYRAWRIDAHRDAPLAFACVS